VRLLIPRLLIGVFLFALGGGLLFLTNRLRFGSGWEFGHKLNLNFEPTGVVVYTTRFDNPFTRVPFMEAARELFGALFRGDSNFNQNNWYVQGIFPGQSPAVRWRRFNLTTYHVSYAVCIGLAWAVAAWAFWSWLRSLTASVPESKHSEDRSPPFVALIIMWSVLSSVPLAAFYMRTPAIADRYLLDFSPAFAAALIGLWCWMVEGIDRRACHSKWTLLFFCLMLTGWQGWEIYRGKSEFGPPLSRTREELPRQTWLQNKPYKPLPNKYRMGQSLEVWGIQFNGSGWDETNGELCVSAIFFVQNPEFLELELATAGRGNVKETAVADIRAKVGLEFLDRESIVHTNGGWIVRFAGPKERRYQYGVQPVFLAVVRPQDIGEFVYSPTPWILRQMRWRTE
jgi:hypothetical protein